MARKTKSVVASQYYVIRCVGETGEGRERGREREIKEVGLQSGGRMSLLGYYLQSQ